MTPAQIEAAFAQASSKRDAYVIHSIQPTARGWRVYVTRMRAPATVERHKHFAGTGLQVLMQGRDCVRGLDYLEVREHEDQATS